MMITKLLCKKTTQRLFSRLSAFLCDLNHVNVGGEDINEVIVIT